MSDAQLVAATRIAMRGFAARVPSQRPQPAAALSILETAGGVCSPAPSGTLQVQRRACLNRSSRSQRGHRLAISGRISEHCTHHMLKLAISICCDGSH